MFKEYDGPNLPHMPVLALISYIISIVHGTYCSSLKQGFLNDTKNTWEVESLTCMEPFDKIQFVGKSGNYKQHQLERFLKWLLFLRAVEDAQCNTEESL